MSYFNIDDSETRVYIFATKDEDGWKSPVKVGISNNVNGRLSTIRTSCPNEIGLYHSFRLPKRSMAVDLESGFHWINADKRRTGEWFDVEPAAAERMICFGVVYHLLGSAGAGNKLTPERVAAWCEWIGARITIDPRLFEDGEAA